MLKLQPGELRIEQPGGDESEIEQLADLLSESLDLETTLPAALQFILDKIGRPAGLILAQPPGAAAPVRVVTLNLPAECTALVQEPASSIRRLVVDILASGRPVTGAAAGVDPAVPLGAAVPLSASGGQLGVLIVCGPDCSPPEIERLQRLSRPLGRALQLHETYAAARGGGRETAALHKIAATLTSTLQLDEILTSTIDGIRQILNVEAGSLVLLDEERGGVIFKKTLSGEPDWIVQHSLNTEQGLVGECLRSGQPLLSNTAASDPRFYAALDGVTGFDTRSVLCAPLVARGQTLGALEVMNKRGGLFTAHDQELLASMAASVANAIYNARLFHQLTVANADLEASRWEVLRSRSTLQALFDGIPEPIYIVDRDYSLVAANLTSGRLAGGEPHLLLGRRCYEAICHLDQPCSGCRVAEALFHGQSVQRTERRRESSGQPTEWEISIYPIRSESGEALQAIVFGQDVTDKRRLEASLAQSEKLAAVGQLAAGVAHEINNPLAAIIANTQLLQRELPPDDERQESISLIARAGDRAMRVVRSLLDFARQERYEFTPTDLNASIRSATTLIEHQLVALSATLVCDLANDLPPIQASLDHLQGMWLNLLLNARDALNGEKGEIRVTTRRVGNEIHVAVTDTGMGIAPEHVSRIFDPFYTTKAPGRGTGLGLSACQRIVKQHGGSVRVDSQAGQGTAFTVILPIA